MHILISIIILVITLIIGVPVAFAFLASAAYMMFVNNYDPTFLLPYGFNKMNSTLLLAIPLFIMSGGVLEKGDITNKLIDFVEIFVKKVKGGLGNVTIVASAIFGSITGSSAATLSAMATIMLPKMRKDGFSKGHAASVLANSSLLGMLIPPSGIMILYSWVGSVSVLRTFLATVVPGIILMFLFCLVNMYIAKREITNVKPIESNDESFFTQAKDRGKKALPAATLPLLVLGGIYGGIMTPTQAAGVGVFYAGVLGFLVYRGLTWKKLFKVLLETAATTGIIMILIYTVMMLSRLYIMEGLTDLVMNFLTMFSSDKIIVLLMINVVLIFIGMIMDDTSGILLATPILLPIITQLGVDPVHFAAIIAVNLGMGNITPPTAPLLYLSGRFSGAKLNEMLVPTLLMIIFAWIPTLLLTTYMPEISLFLPNLLLGD